MTVKNLPQITDAQTLRLQRSSVVQGQNQQAQNVAQSTSVESSFSHLMQQEIQRENGVQFSKHAEARIKQRGIEMSPDMVNSLNDAVERARQKGAKDTVIIGAHGAFIVNVPNNVVITTMTEQEMKNNIFTNIDSAVLM